MAGNFDTQWIRRPAEDAADVEPAAADDSSPVDLIMGVGEPQRIGRFRFFLDGQRWEWSDALARMHGYQPGTVVPTTELLLEHKHPDDRLQVAAVLDRVLLGEAFGSRHRIIDTAGDTHWVIVVGDDRSIRARPPGIHRPATCHRQAAPRSPAHYTAMRARESLRNSFSANTTPVRFAQSGLRQVSATM